MTTDELRHCSYCQGQRAFLQPECADDHGRGCPEWICGDCGAAYLVGFPARRRDAAPASRVA